MFLLIGGIVLIGFGICLVGDVGGTATRIFDFFESFMNPGRATPTTLRIVGAFVLIVGAGWFAASFSVM
ncbi:hypothetical protein [Streptomyces lycii]|uniref:Uncharacterized protein n=1 Tax=Streptomyces lycii TaxID=2654337 RepID=A0ABQ7FJV8_9ACTN|nr:hypothetical protein [Streptomyces lycii]KAF4408917.1 hypothetical protein GCU69_11570 [Streptomyces lycii]